MDLIIDIGATYTKYAYYDHFQCVESHKFLTVKTNHQEFCQKIKTLVHSKVKRVSISMPGLIENGYIQAISLLPFLKAHHLQDELSQLFHIPVLIENDAKCATLGEMWQGSLKNVCNGMMIVLGSGIGGTLIINGQIIDSPRHKAGEIGSILMPKDFHYDDMTNFGRHNNANKLIKKVSQEAGIENDGQVVFEYLKNHQSDVFDKYCRQIAFMIYNLDYILDLDTVCIGGGISEQDILIENINKQYHWLRENYEEDDHACRIVACQHGNHANILGALSRLYQI